MGIDLFVACYVYVVLFTFCTERYNTKAPMFRLYYTGRLLSTITPTVKQYCRLVQVASIVCILLACMCVYMVYTVSLHMCIQCYMLPSVMGTHFVIMYYISV